MPFHKIHYPVYGGDDWFRVGFCEVCGREITSGELHYRLPGDTLLCDDWACVNKWLAQYERTE